MHVNIIDILTYVCVFKDFTLQKFQWTSTGIGYR
jgi:hypothetical protein